MARARSIKPGFFRNADLVDLPMEARLLFIGLWTLADRSGRLEDRPKQIKMEIFPADNLDCDELINLIASIGMVARYEVDGKRYLQVVNFAKHQNPHRDEKASTIPDQYGNFATTKEAPIKHGANTVRALCNTGVDMVAIGLTPDSGLLTPESQTIHVDFADETDDFGCMEEIPLPANDAERALGQHLALVKTPKAEFTLGFTLFWSAWPSTDRKQSRGKCYETWKKVGAEKSTDQILAHIDNLKSTDSWRKDSGQYIPAPLVYLNQRRWEGVEAHEISHRGGLMAGAI